MVPKIYTTYENLIQAVRDVRDCLKDLTSKL